MKATLLKIIFSFIFFSSLLSCNNATKERDNNGLKVISINIDSKSTVKLSDFVDSISIIPLETTESCYISEIRKIIFCDNKYYIRTTRGWQNGKLYVFDECGKFLYKIGREGIGPGEYTEIEDFCIANNAIKIATYGKIISYDLNGIFIDEKKTNLVVKELCSLNSNEDIVYSYDAYKRDDNLLTIIDSTCTDVCNLMKRSKKEVDKSEANYHPNSLIANENICLFNYPYCDTIYEIRNHESFPAFYIDYMDKKLPENLYKEGDRAKEMDEKRKKFGDYGTIAIMCATDSYLYIGSSDSYYQGYFTLYNFKTSKTLTGRNIVDDMYFIGNGIRLKVNSLPSNMIDGCLYWEVNPSVILQGYEKIYKKYTKEKQNEFYKRNKHLIDVCLQLKEDDNPVLLKIKLKEI